MNIQLSCQRIFSLSGAFHNKNRKISVMLISVRKVTSCIGEKPAAVRFFINMPMDPHRDAAAMIIR